VALSFVYTGFVQLFIYKKTLYGNAASNKI